MPVQISIFDSEIGCILEVMAIWNLGNRLTLFDIGKRILVIYINIDPLRDRLVLFFYFRVQKTFRF